MKFQTTVLFFGLASLLVACGGSKMDENLNGSSMIVTRTNADGTTDIGILNDDISNPDDAKSAVEAGNVTFIGGKTFQNDDEVSMIPVSDAQQMGLTTELKFGQGGQNNGHNNGGFGQNNGHNNGGKGPNFGHNNGHNNNFGKGPGHGNKTPHYRYNGRVRGQRYGQNNWRPYRYYTNWKRYSWNLPTQYNRCGYTGFWYTNGCYSFYSPAYNNYYWRPQWGYTSTTYTSCYIRFWF
ncbi:MAG: hypothetical protein KDD33_12415 [Bdellovibrionales bacterium]|nr:hypothetical protein [Bdellovibrionales bacterium]